MNNFKVQGNGTVKKSGIPAWKIQQEKLNREVVKYRQSKINDGLLIAKKLQDDSEKMINTEGIEDIEEYFLNL